MRYLVVIEKGSTLYGAHVPDLPECVAVGDTEEEVLQLIQEAIELHPEDLKRTGRPIARPSSISRFVKVAAA
jgi:predicted RNase H-like HicB family nuclease